ncbi:hypothetical protein AB0I50_48975, partial [Streptomyces prunicolor]
MQGEAHTMVDVQLLGPVELSAEGRAVEVGPPQRRTVMAALAVDVGRPVAVDAVIERAPDPLGRPRCSRPDP